MGQHLFKVNLEAVDSIDNSNLFLSSSNTDDFSFFYSSTLPAEMATSPVESGNSYQIANCKSLFIKQIQNHLSVLTNSAELKELNTQINNILVGNVLISISNCYEKSMRDITDILENQQRLQTSLTSKVNEEEYGTLSIFAKPFVDVSSKDTSSAEADGERQLRIAKQKQQKAELQAQQISYFALQSLTSVLLILMKSAEKKDPGVVEQILILTNQLCEQIPMKSLSPTESSSNYSGFLFKSLKPVITYIEEVSLTKDPIIVKEAKKILLSFAIAKGSFKDILPVVYRLIFETSDVYDVRGLFLQLNNGLTLTIDQWEKEKQQVTSKRNIDSDVELAQDETTNGISSIPLDYLKSVGAFPSTQMNEKQFTGHFIAAVVLAHIDFDNEINSSKQFECGSVCGSISFEFHPNTFKQLIDIIEQLTTMTKSDSNTVTVYILTVCLRLFTTHLKFLRTVKSHIDRDLLVTNGETRIIFRGLSSKLNDDFDLKVFATEHEVRRWFELLSKVACDGDNQSDQATICKEAAKALVYVIDQQTSSFTEKLSFIHKYIVENKHPLLIEQLFIELNQNVTILSWIEVLCDHDDSKQEKTTALTILYSLIDIYFNSLTEINERQTRQIEGILLLFQQLLLFRLVPQSSMKIVYRVTSDDQTTGETESSAATATDNSASAASLVSKYVTHILSHCIGKPIMGSNLINQMLVGLCLMTKTDDLFNFPTINRIFTTLLPLLAEYLLQNTSNDDQEKNNIRLISWILGKMSNVMIGGSSPDSLEIKHVDKLKSPLFTSGCVSITAEKSPYLLDLFQSNLAVYSQFKSVNQKEQSSSNRKFLMSVYMNMDQGAQLISKMKMHFKDKHRLPKSIEQQANDACASVFAVYIKHYRRINLAKSELSRTDNEKAHEKLLSLYEYASYVQTLFATTKAQGGDCDELSRQIQITTRFLLLTVNESHLIAIIDEDLQQSSMVPNGEQTKIFEYQRQQSLWTKAKHMTKLLRNTMQACIRFKKLMLAKKQAIEHRFDFESILNRAINAFVYGDFYKGTTSIISEELEKSMDRQNERAITRLVTYRFIQTFIQNLLKIKDENRVLIILSVYLPHLRNRDLEWSYLEHIPSANDQLKEEISNSYYCIIKTFLNYLLQSRISKREMLERNIFSLLNLNYESTDICQLHHYQLAETLFTSFVSFVEKPARVISLSAKLIAFNWFRLFVLGLCESITFEELKGTSNQLLREQRQLTFHTFILSELKGFKQLKQSVSTDTEDKAANSSLKDAAIAWFTKAVATNSNNLSSTEEIELCTNQILIILLRCLHLHEHIRPVCATIDYMEEVLYIYRHSQHSATLILALKILRKLIPCLPDATNGAARTIIQNFLTDILFSIGDSFTLPRTAPDLVSELIYIYRTVLSVSSPWQMIATQAIFTNIETNLNLNSLETMNTNQRNNLLASLCILGGYIHPYSLCSIVKTYADEEINDEFQLALITEIDSNARDSDTPDVSPFLIQYLQTNETKSVAADKLRLEIDVLPPNILLLSSWEDPNAVIHSLLDILGSFIEIDTSTTESLLLLQLKRRSICALYEILNSKKLVEIFMEKSYASVIAKLSISHSIPNYRRRPADLRLFNKQHLEQYCLSLDTRERSESFEEREDKDIRDANDQNNSSFVVWNDVQMDHDPLVADALSMNALKYNGWKPYASKTDIEYFRQGRTGNDQISIIPLANHVTETQIFAECGNKHKFPGRINLSSANTSVTFPKFIVENLQLSQGKWYYCVKLPVGGAVQIGWVTTGFSVQSSIATGNDQYSWTYDGSCGYLYNDGLAYCPFESIRWKENDICGCGIEIDGDNTQIKYWLNGQLLGTAFSHISDVRLSATQCNMLPNGPDTTFSPGISFQASSEQASSCEFIFSPEDMHECPLPNGYKPLLLPKLIHIENSIVIYPYSAYLVGDDIHDYFHTTRMTTSTTFLRDFVNKHHLETKFMLNNHQLVLPENSGGFPFSIDIDGVSSLTISFDFVVENTTDKKLEIPLFTLDTSDLFSVRIPLDKTDGETRTAIVFDLKQRQTKIYIYNECRTIDGGFESETMTKLNLHLLPNVAARIKNLALWKSALPEEQIRRLFTYGLSYVAVDHQQMKEYRKQANHFSFTQSQQHFESELLVAFNQPFEENLWEKKKTQADNDESKYFKPISATDKSSIQLFGNETYLVLDKSTDQWFEYTLALDILISDYPASDQQLTLVTLNSRSEVSITDDGHLRLSGDGTNDQSISILIKNQYLRIFIVVREESLKIYVDGMLELDVCVGDNRFQIISNRIDLFRENDLSKNSTSSDTLRIECRSVTFLNRPTTTDDNFEPIRSPTYSLEGLVTPSYWIIAPSLIALGYKKPWIKSVIKQYDTTKIQLIDTILREQKQQFLQNDLQDHRKRYFNILSKLGPSVDREKLENLLSVSKFDTDEQVASASELMFIHWNELQTSKASADRTETDENQKENVPSEHKWFHQSVRGLEIRETVAEWIRDKSTIAKETDDVYRLLDLSQLVQEQTTTLGNHPKKIQKSIQYSHRHVSRKQYLDSRIACEHGLTIIYARYTVLNILKVWSNDGPSLFPLEKFGDYAFIVTLLRLMDFHFTYTRTHVDESIDRMSLLASSILKAEIEELLKQSQITNKILQTKAPLLSQLQRAIIGQLIQFSIDPSLLNDNSYDETNLDEQTMIRQANVNFLFKIINLFVDLIKDQSTIKQHCNDLILPLLFPLPFINLIFNLFLLVTTHQRKIFILHLFANLIQASDKFELSGQIQQFLCQLLMEVSVNAAIMKNFQTSILDLVFLLVVRHKRQRMVANVTEILTQSQNQAFQLNLAEFPQSVRDLFTAIDVINILTKKTMETQLPEVFIAQSAEVLGDSQQLSQEDHEQSNRHFDSTADRQLINLMNKNVPMADSFSDFIRSLPTEPEQNSTFYNSYPALTSVPTVCVSTRAKLFYLFNKFIEKVLPIVDLNSLPGQSILTDKIRAIKPYLLYTTKFQWFNESLEKTQSENGGEWIQVNFDTVKANDENKKSENTMFYQAYEQLHENAHITFRRPNEQIWHAQYLGMHSTDQGGPYRDSITRICLDICSTRLPLFILCSNGRTNSGLNRDCWVPNLFPPNQPIPNKFKKEYRFIGQLMGMAIRRKHYLDIKFPILLWKQLVRDQITIEDIEAIDMESFTMINEMEKKIEQTKLIDSDSDINYLLSSVMSELRFEVVSSAGQIYELVPGGKDIPITAANLKQYCASYRDYRLNEFRRQIEFIRQGLYSVIPCYNLSLFTAGELEEAVCGKGQIDVELLKRNTLYGSDFNQDSPHIQRFWTVFSEMFNDEQRKLFLIFVWGRSTLPSRNEDFTAKFIINSFDVDNSQVDRTLPQSHTCSFTIDVPQYSTTEIMYERINYAITYCLFIDGDGNMNEAPVPTDLNADPSLDDQ